MTPAEEARYLRNLRRRVNRIRRFPTNTCPASRHLHMIAEALAAGRPYHMLTEEPLHCAGTMLSVLESLWKLRAKHPATKKDRAAAISRAILTLKRRTPA